MSQVGAKMNRTAKTSGNLNKRIPLVLITGKTPDILEQLDFSYSYFADELLDPTRNWNTKIPYYSSESDKIGSKT